MEASRFKTVGRVGSLRPDTLVLLLLAAWWVINLLQAALTGLANDEAYYWYFSQRLDWGYFDHPPMVALLVRLTAWMGGELGIRLACTLLQPIYLYLFWRMLRPPQPTQRDALLYVLLCFAQPMLQLYGFMALPDAPLMMGTVLFLWALKKYGERTDLPHALLLGLTIALLGYSKYHGALVVAFALLAQPRLLRRWPTYAALVIGLLLLLPHLWWQAQHDWVSFHYHLFGRNSDSYKPSYTLEYLAIAVCIFNPLFLWHYACRPLQDCHGWRASLAGIAVGFLLFFALSSVHGHVQPQWLLPLTLCAVALLFDRYRSTRYVAVVAHLFVPIFLIVRLLAICNPMGLKGELWHQREQYQAIANVAGNRPVVFMHTYTAPAKYTFYTGGEAYCTPYFFNRHSQWQFDTSDRALRGREVVVGNFTNRQPNRLPLDMGGGYRQFYYDIVPHYLPTRELSATLSEPLHATLPVQYDSVPRLAPLDVEMLVYNPYSFDIHSNEGDMVMLTLYFYLRSHVAPAAQCPLVDTLRAGTTTHLKCRFRLPRNLESGTFPMGIAIAPAKQRPPDTGPRAQVDILCQPDQIIINQQ